MRTHALKTWLSEFAEMIDGTMTFQFRKDDRNYEVGDVLVLREWDPNVNQCVGCYTGRQASFRVTHFLVGGMFGVPTDHIVMSVVPDNPADQGKGTGSSE